MSITNPKIQLSDHLATTDYFTSFIEMARQSHEANALLELIQAEKIFGWGTDKECLLQYALGRWGSKEGVIVEIGSFKGRSTVCFAKGVKDGNREGVFAIDPHTGAPPWFPSIPYSFTLKEFESNLEKAKISKNVTTIVTDSFQAARIWPALPVRVLFLDGDHSFEGLLADYEQWIEKLVVGGVLLIDDIDDHLHLPDIIRFVEMVITHDSFSDITIVDGILAAVKRDIGIMGHLYHLRESLKEESGYNPLWDERPEREIALKNLQANNFAIDTMSTNHSNVTLIDSNIQTNLSTSECNLLRNFYIYNRSRAMTGLIIAQDTRESMTILTDAIKSFPDGQVQEIKLSQQDWISQIEQSAQSWQSWPVRLLYLDLPEYDQLDYILKLWKIKLSQYAVTIVRKNLDHQIGQIIQELQLFPLQGMGCEENLYWAIWMESRDEQIIKGLAENAKLKSELTKLKVETSKLSNEISAMETSKFWKVRKKWFILKNLFQPGKF